MCVDLRLASAAVPTPRTPIELDAVPGQPRQRVELGADRRPHLEMQVRAGGEAAVADVRDVLTRTHRLPGCHVAAVHVPVDRALAVGVAEHDPHPEPGRRPRLLDDAVGQGVDRRPDGVGDIDAVVRHAPARAEQRGQATDSGPDEGLAVDDVGLGRPVGQADRGRRCGRELLADVGGLGEAPDVDLGARVELPAGPASRRGGPPAACRRAAGPRRCLGPGDVGPIDPCRCWCP